MNMAAATVQVGACVTCYTRAGRGETIVLIGARAPIEHDPLFLHLAERFRVIAPLVPAQLHATSFDAWLRDFLDCLGLDRVRIVTINDTGSL